MGAPNKAHDTALVQAMLSVVKNAHGQRYHAGHYDGVFGNHTLTAIRSFQTDRKLVSQPVPGRPTPPTASKGDAYGVVCPGGPTLNALSSALPATHKDIRTAEGARTVYWPGSEGDSAHSASSITKNAELHPAIREAAANLVRVMFDKHEIVLTLTASGGRRDFAKQYEIATTPDEDGNYATGAGPGESNHNFGQAVDIGPNGLKWMAPNGVPVNDDWWLNKLTQSHKSWARELWNVRDAIGVQTLGLFNSKLPGDFDHLQRYSDDNVSMVKSLAKLLDMVGALGWRYHQGYQSDLGFDGPYYGVGTAVQIWEGSGPLKKDWLAAGMKVPVAQVKDSDVTVMRKKLRTDFEKAEDSRDRWTPEPK
jgi:hypothetical protein